MTKENDRSFKDSYASIFISKIPGWVDVEFVLTTGEKRQRRFELKKNALDIFGKKIKEFYSTIAFNFSNVKEIKILTQNVELQTLWK